MGPARRPAVLCPKITIKLLQGGNVDDRLTKILRNGARALLAKAVEVEVADFLSKHADLKRTATSASSATVTWRNAR